jgi:hypothetical protein
MDTDRHGGTTDTMSTLTDTRRAPAPRPAARAATSNPHLSSRIPRIRARRLHFALVAAGLAMIPWLFVLALALPATTTAGHWNAAWTGLDGMEALGLLGTGLLLRRGDARAALTAACTATLLVVDAWFDLLTAAPGADRLLAAVMAGCAELPLAVLCGVIAVRRFHGA